MAVTRTERLLNLVIALLSARTPLSRGAIQSSVAGYDPEASTAAFERMFERDKDELRSMGIPVETITDAHGEVIGYLVDSDEYSLPPIDLTFEELSVVSLAARVWDEAVLGPAAVTGLRKLETQIPSGGAVESAHSFGSLDASEAAFLPLLRAVRERRVVRFDYRKPSSEHATTRTVEPWSMSCRDGHWYLVGHDRERQERRSFRLSRINGKVTVTAEDCTTPADLGEAEIPPDPQDEIDARILVPEGVGMEVRRHPGATQLDGDLWRVLAPQHELVALLLRADASIVAVSPPELLEATAHCLDSLVELHQ